MKLSSYFEQMILNYLHRQYKIKHENIKHKHYCDSITTMNAQNKLQSFWL